MNTLNRKAWADLTTHRARTLLTAFTLSIAVASLGFLAVPGLLNAAMNRQVQQSHLYEVGISTRVIQLTPAQLAALGKLPGVAAVSPVLGYVTSATSAAGTQNVAIAGGDLASAAVNTVPLMSGQLPGPGQVLADAANARAASYGTPENTQVSLRAADGGHVTLTVTGTGMNLAATPGANGSTVPVFYATLATVEQLRGIRGYNYLGFRLTDDTTAVQNQVIAEVRAYLTQQAGSDPITSVPATRDANHWPGQNSFTSIMKLLYIITILAFASALFLISATMNTLITEQAAEIAILKTLGARRRQIAAIILHTAGLLGTAGAVIGTVLGIVIAYLLAGDFAVKFVDVRFGFGVDVPVVVASLLLGPVLAAVASLPALRRALRKPVTETLTGATTSGYGRSALDRQLARESLLIRSSGIRMGVRNALRQKGRSIAAIVQVAVAAGLAMSFFALGQSITADIGQTVGKLHFSIAAGEATSAGARPFTSEAIGIAAATSGVTGVRPVEASSVEYNGQGYAAWGLGPNPLYSYHLSAGRWFTAADAGASTPPVVLGPVVARAAGAAVGQTITLTTASGPARVRVIGIDTGQNNGGGTVYFPLATLERLDGTPGTTDSIWISTASSAHSAIDRVNNAVTARLAAAGYPVSTTEIYVVQAQTTSSEASILAIVDVLGLLIVAIMLMGLVSALTMAVFERTREVGVLRCTGARSRQIRRIFSAEALTLALAGWLLGVLIGWLIYEGLLALIQHDVSLSLPREFGPFGLLGTLAGVVILTLLVIRGPLRRATRIQPGLALRYQ